jgi:HK97 family phage major capsid protein
LDALWSQTWLSQAGARFLTGLSGNPRFPVQTTKPTVSELTEIEEMGYTEILFSDFQMSPKRRGVTIPISKQVIMQASEDVQGLVTENISLAIAQYMNVEAISIILGAITAGNNNLLALGANGAAPTYENLVDLEALVDNKDALLFAPKYLTNTKVKAKMKKTQVFTGTSGEPVWGKGSILNDYPALVSNLIPSNLTKGTASAIASAIVFGNFRDLYVGLWGGVEFIVDPYSAKKKAQVEITANTFYDIKVARTESFAGIKDALTA